MKKILSLTLAVMLLVSAIPTAFAADQDYTLGTAVTVEGAGGEYTVTVPATLNAGNVGTVTAKGYWASGETLKVTAPATIEVTNTVTNQKATVNVDFDGIESLGDDLEELTKTASISVDKGNTKFGTWTGTIVYNVELDNGIVDFYVGPVAYQVEDGTTWEEWIVINGDSSYYISDNNIVMRKGNPSDVTIYNGTSAVLATDVIQEISYTTA